MFERAKALLNTYAEDDLPLFGGKPGDEPVMEIAMVEAGIRGVEDTERNKMYCTPDMQQLYIDVLRGTCRVFKRGERVTPTCMHWGTAKTKLPMYRREEAKIRCRFYGFPRWICDGYGILVWVATKVFSIK